MVPLSVQDEHSLYMGLEYCPGGELYHQLQLRGKLSLSDAQQYTAHVVDILEQLR
jgi:3-phosphoinositide dependent protein kinase-1